MNLQRDRTGRLVVVEYNHTDASCRAGAAIVAEAVEQITSDTDSDSAT